MQDKKVIRSNSTRQTMQEKLKLSLAKKPTAFSLARQGLTTEELNKIIANVPEKTKNAIKQIASQPIIRRTTRNKPVRPAISPPLTHHKTHNLLVQNPISLPNSITYPTPPWFQINEKADVSIIIPLFKSEKVIADLINSLNLEEDKLKVEIIFVDDACPHNSKEAVLEACSKIKKPFGKIIVNAENSGFGRACNIGSKYANGDYLIFLNADTTVTKNWIKPMYDLFKTEEKVGIVGNLHLKEGGIWHGTIDSAGSEWNWRTMSFEHIGRHIYKGEHISAPFKPEAAPNEIMQLAEREMVTGCCFMIPKKLFEYVGCFNHNYRIGYWEDTELCLTVRQHGYKILFQPNSVIWHKLSHSSSGGHSFYHSNVEYFMNRWVNSNRIDKMVGNKRPDNHKVDSILIKRTGANGDVLLASGVLPALKNKYPEAKISFLTACYSVLVGNPFLHKVFFDNNVNGFQVIYNLDYYYEYRPKMSILEGYADAVGVDINDCKIHIRCDPVKIDLKDYIVVHAGRTDMWVGRNWKTENWTEIARRLKAEGHKIVLVGNQKDFELPFNIDMRGKTTATQLATVIKNAKFFLGIDSFPMHVAQALEKDGIVFFGSVSPDRILIPNSKIRPIFAKNLPCIGCHHRQKVPCIGTHVCERGDIACEKEITVDMLWEEVKKML
jgi:GT2 family glycosyltransferase/ADP-heptose:LPS heptosyltransferase